MTDSCSRENRLPREASAGSTTPIMRGGETAIMSKNLPFHTALCILSVAVDECVRNESPVVYVDACSCGEEGRLIIAGFMDMSRHVQPIGCLLR